MNENGSRPLIGVTTSEIRHKRAISERTPQGDPPQVELALGLDYTRAIEQAGGIPVVLPPLPPDAAKPLLAGLAGCACPAARICTRPSTALRPIPRRARSSPTSTASSWPRPVPPGRWDCPRSRSAAGPRP